MGTAIAVRTGFSSRELRRVATRVKEAAQARRLLAIAAVLDGSSREEAAKIGGMDRQTLRDWVIRFNEEGPDSLVNKSSPGAPGKLTEEHKAFLVRLVEEGPIPAVDGVVRWRACALIMRLYEEFGISVSDDTVYRALKDLGFSHVSARPKAYKQNAEAMEAFKKLSCPRGGGPGEACARHTDRGVVPGRDAGWPEEQAHLSMGQEGLTPPRRSRSTHPVDLSVRGCLPRTRGWRRPSTAGLQQRGHATPPRRNRNQSYPRRARDRPPRSSRVAWRQGSQGPKQPLAHAAAAARTRTQRSGKYLAIHAAELALEPCLQILRRHRRPLLLRLEHAYRSTLEDHVHRAPRLDERRLLNVRIGIKPHNSGRLINFINHSPTVRKADPFPAHPF